MEPPSFEFENALQLLKSGGKVSRLDWESKEAILEMKDDKIFIGNIFIWSPTLDDILAKDWIERDPS